MVNWVRYGTCLYRFLIFAIFITLRMLVDLRGLSDSTCVLEAISTKLNIKRREYQLTHGFTLQTCDYDAVIDFRVESTSFKKYNVMMT